MAFTEKQTAILKKISTIKEGPVCIGIKGRMPHPAKIPTLERKAHKDLTNVVANII